jgi:hypothetical protein
MAMLHPRFNHLGRSAKKKAKPTKAQEKANQTHSQFLAKMGLNPNPQRKRVRLKGYVSLENAAVNPRTPVLVETSNDVGGWAPKKVLR